MKKELSIENINTTEKLGVALKRLRKLNGMSQSELANLMGMRQPTISDIENGNGGTLDSFFKIIQALKLNVALSNMSNISKENKKTKAQEVIDLMEKVTKG